MTNRSRSIDRMGGCGKHSFVPGIGPHSECMECKCDRLRAELEAERRARQAAEDEPACCNCRNNLLSELEAERKERGAGQYWEHTSYENALLREALEKITDPKGPNYFGATAEKELEATQKREAIALKGWNDEKEENQGLRKELEVERETRKRENAWWQNFTNDSISASKKEARRET